MTDKTERTGHTPGTIAINGTAYACIVGADGKEVAITETGGQRDTEVDAANALRIVACWNGCAGVNPEAVQALLVACQDVTWFAKLAYAEAMGKPSEEGRAVLAEASVTIPHAIAAIALAEPKPSAPAASAE